MIKQYMKMAGHNFATLLTHHTIRTIVEFGKGTVQMDTARKPTTSIITISFSTANPHGIGSIAPALYKTYKEMEDKADVLLTFHNMAGLLALQAHVNDTVEFYKDECNG